jgi:hypothetical protein
MPTFPQGASWPPYMAAILSLMEGFHKSRTTLAGYHLPSLGICHSVRSASGSTVPCSLAVGGTALACKVLSCMAVAITPAGIPCSRRGFEQPDLLLGRQRGTAVLRPTALALRRGTRPNLQNGRDISLILRGRVPGFLDAFLDVYRSSIHIWVSRTLQGTLLYVSPPSARLLLPGAWHISCSHAKRQLSQHAR